jgi:ribulose-bisphosphate carboxylase large chain
MGFGKMEGEAGDRIIAAMIENDVADGPYFSQEWYGMNPTTPIISGGMNALRTQGFFNNLGHANLIMTSGGGSYGHLDGPAEGATSIRQAYHAWRDKIDLLEYAKSHKQLARAFESFSHDADMLYPNWRKELGVG